LEKIWDYFREHGRYDLPWRLPEGNGTFDPYKILVSEIMLQQTQVPRVIPKYTAFVAQFPTSSSLAAASLGTVLRAWQGLGYNRRAKFLWQAAQMIEQEYAGVLPHDQAALEHLPGVGRNTAGAIRAYAFNEPAVFIETNIRTVYIHHFFTDQSNVTDAIIIEELEKDLRNMGKRSDWSRFWRDSELLRKGADGKPKPEGPQAYAWCDASVSHYRAWYWALMDYGSYLKSTAGNAAKASKSYTKQSRFQGSMRQLRGRVLKLLTDGQMAKADLFLELGDERSEPVIAGLVQEGIVRENDGSYSLP
jgi:A/G-specific adenine glycosylase